MHSINKSIKIIKSTKNNVNVMKSVHDTTIFGLHLHVMNKIFIFVLPGFPKIF